MCLCGTDHKSGLYVCYRSQECVCMCGTDNKSVFVCVVQITRVCLSV